MDMKKRRKKEKQATGNQVQARSSVEGIEGSRNCRHDTD